MEPNKGGEGGGGLVGGGDCVAGCVQLDLDQILRIGERKSGTLVRKLNPATVWLEACLESMINVVSDNQSMF